MPGPQTSDRSIASGHQIVVSEQLDLGKKIAEVKLFISLCDRVTEFYKSIFYSKLCQTEDSLLDT